MSGPAAEAAAADWLAVSALPQAWQGRSRFTVVDSSFGGGARLEALRRVLRDDPRGCACLAYWALVSEEQSRIPLGFSHRPAGTAATDARLLPGIQVFHLDGGRVRLYLAVGPLRALAGEQVAAVDLFWLSDPATLAAQRVAALTRRRMKQACAVIGPGHGPDVHRALQAAGFEPSGCPEPPGFERFTLRPSLKPAALDHRWGPWSLPSQPAMAAPPPQRQSHGHPGPLHGRRVAVLGAGLAGCATARSLADLGAEVHLIDRHAAPASETSGNPAGLVHSVFHHPDTPHARLLRAAAWHAARDGGLDRESPTDSDSDAVGGRGLIQLQPGTSLTALRTALRSSALPAWHIEALGAEQTAEATGLPAAALASHAAWRFGDGGWLDPSTLCRRWIDPADGAPANLHWHGGVELASIERTSGGWGLRAEAVDPDGGLPGGIFHAIVVAASGSESRRLLAPHTDAALWPLEPVRGQLGIWDAGTPGLRRPRMAVTGQGYAIPLPDGRVLVGATSQAGDTDLRQRPEDAFHLGGQALRLGILERPASGESSGPEEGTAGPAAPQSGRVGIRWRTPDRLPIIGAVADPGTHGRADQCRFVSRVPGLHVFTALGSRGIAWARFGAELLASSMAGLPAPLESSLLDRVDPARFRVKRVRRSEDGDPAPANGRGLL